MKALIDSDVGQARDPFLDLPLHGVRLIEASAGTGKTFTLGTLVTRLVIERGLRIGQILAVTFTEAATQELRERLRLRLALAARIAAGDPALADSRAGDVLLTRAMISARLQHESPDALRVRLQRAAAEIDLAAVFTIHGFCARVLREHALETGQAFAAADMVGSDRELRDEVAADLWRSLGADPVSAELLQAQWPGGPDALAVDLGALLRTPHLLPAIPATGVDPSPALREAADALQAAFARHGDDAREQLENAIAGKVLNGGTYKVALPAELWGALDLWRAIGDPVRAIHPNIDRLTPARLSARTNKGKEARTPASPLFDAIAAFVDAHAAREHWLAACGIALVHRVRDEAAQRLARLKQDRRVQTYDDLIDGVAHALDGAHGQSLARQLRAQYAVALVDEFQDTDARQWAIFARVFGAGIDAAGPPVEHSAPLPENTHADGLQPRFLGPAIEPGSMALVSAQADGLQPRFLALIGDPKQAIYRFRGGDVHTYLGAAATAKAAPPLGHNFRSRPSLLRAIDTLYQRAGSDAFVDPRIRFLPVAPGGRVADADYRRDGRNAPALTVRVLPPPADERKSPVWTAPESRDLAARACVAAIHGLLTDARAGRATIGDRNVQPGDVAVLVRSHDEATRMQSALVAAGIAAVAAGRQSLFATEQAHELLSLFDAMLQPGDDGRLRAALATVLIGLNANDIDRLDGDEPSHRDWQARALGWRERWQRSGPLALVADLCAQHAPRLLALPDGERRLTNLLQLAEALQDADARALGAHGLVDWLRRQIAEADDNDEAQQLRLESDAHRVQILTLHKSKGLEFPLVFLPFAGIGREPRTGRWCEVPGDDGRTLHVKVGEGDDPGWQAASDAAKAEERAEDARLLYVGLTRAQHALWLATGPLYNARVAPLAAMLGDPATLATDAGEHAGEHADEIVIDASGMPPSRLAPLPPEPAGALPEARRVRRTVSRDWWVYSFTQLTHADAGHGTESGQRAETGERAAADEPVVPLAAGPERVDEIDEVDQRFSGSRFGNVMHAALENVDFAAWHDWAADDPPPTGQDEPLRAALRGEGYAAADLDDGIAALAPLVGQTLTVRLPEGVRLSEVPVAARRAEMEFHFALQPTSVDALLATLHAHGVLRERRGFGLRRQLEGMMTGKIDLVYAHEGRYYVLDYKSNRLPGYDPAAIERAMADSEYTLQALIYTVALHRWLRFRLGDGYDYARDFGGVRYLFCRGLDARDDMQPGDMQHGLHARQPERALVDALDRLFGTHEVAA